MLNKQAQRRKKLLEKLTEKSDMNSADVGKFFSPELKRVMGLLKDADDSIRSILSGEKVGTAPSPDDKVSLKDLLKSAKSNFNRREYMASAAELGRFHKKMFDAVKIINTFDLGVNRIHHDFLFQGLNSKQKENIQKLRSHMSTKAEIANFYFIKEAGIMDFFYNLGTQRGRALAAWEKKYPKVAQELKNGLENLLDKAESTLAITLSSLKDMVNFRKNQSIDEYVDTAKEIVKTFNKFDDGKDGFKSFYSSVIKPYLDKQDEYEKLEIKPTLPVGDENSPEVLIDQVLPPSTPKAPDTIPTPPNSDMLKNLLQENRSGISSAPITPVLPVNHFTTNVSPNGLTLPIHQTRTLPIAHQNTNQPRTQTIPYLGQPPQVAIPPNGKIPSFPSEAPDTKPSSTIPISSSDILPDTTPSPSGEKTNFKSDQLAKEMWGKNSHFINSLQSLSQESPQILGKYISKYAKSIQSNNQELAVELFNLVKRINKEE